jgi:hypothetical protein
MTKSSFFMKYVWNIADWFFSYKSDKSNILFASWPHMPAQSWSEIRDQNKMTVLYLVKHAAFSSENL